MNPYAEIGTVRCSCMLPTRVQYFSCAPQQGIKNEPRLGVPILAADILRTGLVSARISDRRDQIDAWTRRQSHR